jgi:4-hydroxy-tetrahydrodipicolinate synthase
VNTRLIGNVRGVWPVMLTPFREDRAIDWAGLDALVEWYLAAGVSGLFAVCLSSEMYELTPEERVRLAAHVVNRVAGRVPVVAAGAFGESIAVQAEAARRVAATGVAAVVLTVNQLAAAEESDTDWQTHAEAMLDACADIPLGLYECPVPYRRNLSPALLGWAARSGRVLFLKDTCCVLARIRAKLDAIRGTPMGWYNAHCPSLLQSLRLGGHGYSGIAANLYPELFTRLCAEFADQPEEAERLHRFLTLADLTIRQRYPVLAKRWLGMQGLPIGETCRLPVAVGRADDDERLVLENLREAVAEIAARGGRATANSRARETAGRESHIARPAQKEDVVSLVPYA